MKGWAWLAASAVMACGIDSRAIADDPPPAKRPNIVFILADDWGWGDLGCYGHDRIKTPNLDRLASQGTLFTQYYQCGSVCSPSRTSLMTGKYPARFSIHGHLAGHDLNQQRGMPDWLDPNAMTLPKLLRAQGFSTGHVGKWHLGNGPGAPLSDRYGFDAAKVSSAGPTTEWELSGPDLRPKSTELIVDETIKFIEEHKDGPFYVQAWLMDTHAILMPTPEQLAAYPNLQPKNLPFTSPMHVYAAAATDADRHIGRLLAKLGELGLRDNTYVVFSSDNGPEAMEIGNASHSGVGSAGPLRGRKRSLYDGGIRVPLIVSGPGVPAGRVSDAVIAGCDFLPTVCALTGVNVPEPFDGDGENRADSLKGNDSARTRPLFWEWRFRVAGHPWNRSPILAVRDGDWKLLLNPDRSRVELYDLASDPGESDNKADTHANVVERLAKAALDWQKTLPGGPIEPAAGSNAYPKPGARPVARPNPNAQPRKQADARSKTATKSATTKGGPRP